MLLTQVYADLKFQNYRDDRYDLFDILDEHTSFKTRCRCWFHISKNAQNLFIIDNNWSICCIDLIEAYLTGLEKLKIQPFLTP